MGEESDSVVEIIIYLLLILGDQQLSVERGGDETVKWIDPRRWIDSPHVKVCTS